MTTQADAQPAIERPQTSAQMRLRWAERIRQWLLTSNAALIFAFLYLPVVILVVFSFNNTRSVAVFTGFSTEWYSKLITNVELLDAARNSLIVGIIATLVSTAIGTILAIGMDRYRFRAQTALEANLYLPIVIPEIVMGISLLLFFNQALFPFIQTLTGYRASTGLHTITVSHIAFNIPFVYVIVRARLADFDRALEEAAQDLGANEWRTFTRITLPLLMPGIIGGALLAFTLSLDDYLITVFTKGVKEQTMPIYIYSLVRRGVTPEINALSTALLLGSIGLVALSLTAQSGGRLFTRAMTVGVAFGTGIFGLINLIRILTAGDYSITEVLIRVIFLLGLIWAWRAVRAWRLEWEDANTSGIILSVIALIIVGLATYVSFAIMLI